MGSTTTGGSGRKPPECERSRTYFVNDYGLGAELAGWRIQRIDDVSDDGLVLVGNGLNPAGQSEGFAIVIPEPSAMMLVGQLPSAVTAAAFRRRARPFR